MTCGIPRLSPCDLIRAIGHGLTALYWWSVERQHWVEIAPGRYVRKRDLEQTREVYFGPLSPFGRTLELENARRRNPQIAEGVKAPPRLISARSRT